jgi:hypothetical protein
MIATRKQPVTAQNDLDFYTNRCDGLPRDGVLRRPSRGAALRDQIDALVYDLYALTPAEIKIVEGTAK